MWISFATNNFMRSIVKKAQMFGIAVLTHKNNKNIHGQILLIPIFQRLYLILLHHVKTNICVIVQIIYIIYNVI